MVKGYAPVSQDDLDSDGGAIEAEHDTGGPNAAPPRSRLCTSILVATTALGIILVSSLLWAIAAAKCDGVVFFVGGFHHSGTTVMQHELLRRTNRGRTKTRAPESWPPRWFGCPAENAVFKHPTSEIASVLRMVRLRDRYPNVRLIHMQRDLPNTIWSLYKRMVGVKRQEALSHYFTDWCISRLRQACAVRAAWARRGDGDALSSMRMDYTVYLHDFTERTDEIMAPILAPSPSQHRRVVEMPFESKDHDHRRWHQAMIPVYPDNIMLFREETSDLVAGWLEDNMRCG